MIDMWLGGESYAPPGRKRSNVVNPMTRQTIDELVVADGADVDHAFTMWRALTAFVLLKLPHKVLPSMQI